MVSEEELQSIDDIISELPDNEKDKVKEEIISIIEDKQSSEERKKDILDKRNGRSDEEKESSSLQDRVEDFCDYLRDELGISDTVGDDEILQSFKEDFPNLEQELVQYINTGDEKIFTSLQTDIGQTETVDKKSNDMTIS